MIGFPTDIWTRSLTTQSYQSAVRQDIQVAFSPPSNMSSPFKQQCDILYKYIIFGVIVTQSQNQKL